MRLRVKLWLIYLEIVAVIALATLLGYLVGYLAGKTI